MKHMTENQRLLAEYARNGSETAFRELVARYINLIYSAAVRLVDGDKHRAQDVTQTVFVDLARMARTLSSEVMLGGWLHRHTCFVASKMMRSERRRQSRERWAMEMNALQNERETSLARIAPILDEAINQLGAQDRAAILLRFFEQRDLRSVGEVMGTSENTARMRVTRALDKLHSLLKRHGITFSAAALGTVLASDVVAAAPAGLASSISVTALAGAAAGGGTALTLLKIITMTKIKTGLIGALAIAGAATTFVIQHQAQARLNEKDEFLRQQTEQLAQLQTKNQQLSNMAALANNPPPGEPLKDLQRLRGEVEALRRQTNELAALAEENHRLRQSQSTDTPVKSAFQIKEEAIVKMNTGKQLVLGLIMYANDNQQQFPTNFEQTTAYLGGTNIAGDTFELTYQGDFRRIATGTNPFPSDVMVVREKEAWLTAPTADRKGKWAKIYGFADGHIEIHQEAENNFDAYEQQHAAR